MMVLIMLLIFIQYAFDIHIFRKMCVGGNDVSRIWAQLVLYILFTSNQSISRKYVPTLRKSFAFVVVVDRSFVTINYKKLYKLSAFNFCQDFAIEYKEGVIFFYLLPAQNRSIIRRFYQYRNLRKTLFCRKR